MCTGFPGYDTTMRDSCKSSNTSSERKFGWTVSVYTLACYGAKFSDTRRTKMLASRLHNDGRRGCCIILRFVQLGPLILYLFSLLLVFKCVLVLTPVQEPPGAMYGVGVLVCVC
jgi:hypothetical protein